MTHALLKRTTHKPPPALTLWDDIALPVSRVHELCGRARRTLALRIAAKTGGPVLWIAPAWGADPLNPVAVADIVPPRNLVFVTPRRPEDLLWSMEEALRSGVAPVVICDLPGPPPLTPVRRLHLAAQSGADLGKCRPLGLLLTPGDGGAAGVETRYRMDPAHTPDSPRWRLDRLRARMAPPKSWQLGPNGPAKPQQP